MILLRPTRCSAAAAFTLLEVILALAILAGSVAVLSEVMSIASRSASEAQAEALAQMLASSTMDEMLSGMTELTNQSRQSLETDSVAPWVYSVTLGNTTLSGLLSVEVLVEQDVEKQFHPIKYRLVRWLSTESDAAESADSETEDDGDA